MTTTTAPFDVNSLVVVPSSGRMADCEFTIADLRKSKFTFERGLPMSMLHDEMREKDQVLKAIMAGLNVEWEDSYKINSSFTGLVHSITMSKMLTRSVQVVLQLSLERRFDTYDFQLKSYVHFSFKDKNGRTVNFGDDVHTKWPVVQPNVEFVAEFIYGLTNVMADMFVHNNQAVFGCIDEAAQKTMYDSVREALWGGKLKAVEHSF